MVFLSNISSRVVEQKSFGEIYTPKDYKVEGWLTSKGQKKGGDGQLEGHFPARGSPGGLIYC